MRFDDPKLAVRMYGGLTLPMRKVNTPLFCCGHVRCYPGG